MRYASRMLVVVVLSVASVGCGRDGRDGSAPVEQSPAPSTSDAPATPASTAPASSAPASSAPTTTDVAPTASSVPSATIDVPVTPHADPTANPVLSIDIAPWAFPIEGLEPCELAQCPTVATMADGTVVALDEGQNSFWIGTNPPRTVTVSEALNEAGARLVDIGPDDVAYVAVQSTSSTDPVGDLVAVSLSGANAGDVVTRATDILDLTGDTDLVPTAAGLVAVGCCGGGTSRPDPSAPLIMPWVDRAGAPTTDTEVRATIEMVGDALDIVVREGSAARRWPIPGSDGWMRGMPLTAVRHDGSVALTFFDWATGEQQLFVFEPSGAIEAIETGDLIVMSFDGTGAIAHDGTQLVRWQFPTFTEPREALSAVSDWLGADPRGFETADELIDTVVAALAEPNGCEVAPSARVTQRAGVDPVVVTIEYRVSCDDSVAGENIEMTVAPDADGDWVPIAATARGLCTRGGSAAACV